MHRKTSTPFDDALDLHAAKLILDAIRKAKGSKTEARDALGLAHRRLYREIERLDLWPQIDALHEAHPGWGPSGGPPRKAE